MSQKCSKTGHSHDTALVDISLLFHLMLANPLNDEESASGHSPSPCLFSLSSSRSFVFPLLTLPPKHHRSGDPDRLYFLDPSIRLDKRDSLKDLVKEVERETRRDHKDL